jgi:hypothetical protein
LISLIIDYYKNLKMPIKLKNYACYMDNYEKKRDKDMCLYINSMFPKISFLSILSKNKFQKLTCEKIYYDTNEIKIKKLMLSCLLNALWKQKASLQINQKVLNIKYYEIFESFSIKFDIDLPIINLCISYDDL